VILVPIFSDFLMSFFLVEKEEMETSRKDEAVNTAKNQVRLSLPLVSYKKFKNSRFFNRSSVQNVRCF